uniref:Uncharacterized protein n=1 Tax=Arundo donax TaxID=35708 RepID=A0A0A9HH65_ARUDO
MIWFGQLCSNMEFRDPSRMVGLMMGCTRMCCAVLGLCLFLCGILRTGS